MIRDNIKKGFLETQSKVNSWVTTLRKKIDGDDDNAQSRPAPTTGVRSGSSQPQYGGRRSSDYQRRSQDQDRYDADPQVLGDDFTGLQLRDQECMGYPTLRIGGITNKHSSAASIEPTLGEPGSI